MEAQETLDSTIEQAAEAITEGRDAVQGLRVFHSRRATISHWPSAPWERNWPLTQANHRTGISRVALRARRRDLHPILRDEIYKIAAEALRNAFRHAQARQVEVEIRYDR